jgi:hypothetical protein
MTKDQVKEVLNRVLSWPPPFAEAFKQFRTPRA